MILNLQGDFLKINICSLFGDGGWEKLQPLRTAHFRSSLDATLLTKLCTLQL